MKIFLSFTENSPCIIPRKQKEPHIKLRGGGVTTDLYSYQKPCETNNITGARYPHDVLLFKKSNHKSLHPTQKPVELMEWLVKTYTNDGDTVLDCFMGSGSTGVACVRNNRNFIGMELEEKYFEIAKNRIEDESKKAENHAEREPFFGI